MNNTHKSVMRPDEVDDVIPREKRTGRDKVRGREGMSLMAADSKPWQAQGFRGDSAIRRDIGENG
jgi:hypothetical protein